jgi:hypothetical protein
MTVSSPVPLNLRNALIQSIESMADEDLPLVHEVLLHAEKDRLWREISSEAEVEHQSGRWEHLNEIIAQAKSKLRQA